MKPSGRITIAILMATMPALAASAPGIKNFDQVDSHVYRGGQPTAEGFQYLAKIGVKTIVDLRETGGRSENEERTVSHCGMKYVSVPMTGLTPPTEQQITKILAMLEDQNSGPVFVHCWRGADRTGAVLAAYHIDHDKWNNERALADARAHGMSFFQLPRQSYIRNFRSEVVSAAASTTPPAATIASQAPATAGAN